MATEVTVIVDPDGGAGYDYTSLAAAIAGEARDLVTADEQLTIKCRCTGGTADGAATINGFTTDATRFIKIWTDPSESYRHTGTYPSGNKYRIETTGSGIVVSDNYVRILGIAIGVTVASGGSGRGVRVDNYTVGTGILHVGYCYIKCHSTASSNSSHGIYVADTSQTTYVYNSVFTGFYRAGRINTGIYGYGPTLIIYNCTCFGNNVGVRRSVGVVIATNVICANSDDDFQGTITISNSASDDGDGTNAVNISPGATEADDWAACFNDYANGDFSLKSDSVCIGAGTDNPGSGLYSDDIIGTSRTSTWDIGAFEYDLSTIGQFDCTITATCSSVASVAKRISRTLSVISPSSISLVWTKVFLILLSTAVSSLSTLSKQWAFKCAISITQNTPITLTHALAITKNATASPVASLTKGIWNVLSATASSTVSVGKGVFQTLIAAASSLAGLTAHITHITEEFYQTLTTVAASSPKVVGAKIRYIANKWFGVEF